MPELLAFIRSAISLSEAEGTTVGDKEESNPPIAGPIDAKPPEGSRSSNNGISFCIG